MMTASEIIQGLGAPKDHKNTSSKKLERKSKVTTFVTQKTCFLDEWSGIYLCRTGLDTSQSSLT